MTSSTEHNFKEASQWDHFKQFLVEKHSDRTIYIAAATGAIAMDGLLIFINISGGDLPSFSGLLRASVIGGTIGVGSYYGAHVLSEYGEDYLSNTAPWYVRWGWKAWKQTPLGSFVGTTDDIGGYLNPHWWTDLFGITDHKIRSDPKGQSDPKNKQVSPSPAATQKSETDKKVETWGVKSIANDGTIKVSPPTFDYGPGKKYPGSMIVMPKTRMAM